MVSRRRRDTLTVLTVEEVAGTFLPRNALTEAQAASIGAIRSTPIQVDWPSPGTNHRWRLRSNGWVGTFRVDHNLVVRVVPKLPVRDMLGLLEYIGRLDALDDTEVVGASDSLDEAMRVAARSLARRVERRLGLGLCRRYVDEDSRGSRVIGKLLLYPTFLDIARGKMRLSSRMRALRVDVEENQLLLHALSTAAAAGAFAGVDDVRRILRELQLHLTPVRFCADDYLGRRYGRWESDYQAMHRLGALIVRLSGSGSGSGSTATEAIAIYMPEVFETMVCTALRSRATPEIRLAAWRKLRFGGSSNVVFEPDFVLSDITGRAKVVIDAKYKGAAGVDPSDVQQVVAYATALRCTEAVLVYPQPIDDRLDILVGPVHVRSAHIDLSLPTAQAPNELLNLVDDIVDPGLRSLAV
jgi:5-methylcytosine-specific restriction enzyme subunit McrC